MSKQYKAEDKPHKLSVYCPRCRVTRTRTMFHWETVDCRCGLRFMAIQPKRSGPMKLVKVEPLPV